MFEAIINFFKKFSKSEEEAKSKDTAKERLHLVLMQDRANVSADFLDMMKQEIVNEEAIYYIKAPTVLEKANYILVVIR